MHFLWIPFWPAFLGCCLFGPHISRMNSTSNCKCMCLCSYTVNWMKIISTWPMLASWLRYDLLNTRYTNTNTRLTTFSLCKINSLAWQLQPIINGEYTDNDGNVYIIILFIFTTTYFLLLSTKTDFLIHFSPSELSWWRGWGWRGSEKFWSKSSICLPVCLLVCCIRDHLDLPC